MIRVFLLAALALAGCDRFEAAPARPDPAPSPGAAQVVRPSIEAVMKQAAACVERCQLGKNPRGLSDSCAVTPEQAGKLREALDALASALDQAPRSGAAAPAGFLALGRAMDASLKTAVISPEPASGLSMQYSALARAFNKLYPEAFFEMDPPSLVASMKVVPDEESCKSEYRRFDSDYNCKDISGQNYCWYGRGGPGRPPACELRDITPPSPLVWKLATGGHPVLELPPAAKK